ncbi:MAG: hypothetical protein KJN59_02390 [Bacteroidia bacterium]|nr:hypothetical protein [Bacteroidia bacterium]
MITRFFSTSKPIHLVLVTFVLLAVFAFVRIASISDDLDLNGLLKEIGLFLILFASIAVFAFFVSKNALTQHNGFKFRFYTLLIYILPETLINDQVLLANLFIILALRRLFSLKNNLRIKKKLFDAGLWVGLATLIYFGSLLYFGLIFVAVLLLTVSKFNYWIVPILGFATVIIIAMSYLVITEDGFSGIIDFVQPPNYDFSAYNDLRFIISITVLISFSLWAIIFYAKSFAEKFKAERASHHLVLFTFLIGFILIIISPVKDGSEFIFLFAPAAIIMANYLESLSERWFAEIFVWLLIITPVIRLVL